MQSERGSIPGTMLVGLMAATVSFALAGLAVQALNLSHHSDTVQRRHNAAESVIAKAMGEILADPDFAKPGKPGENMTFKHKWMGDEAILTFSAKEAEKRGIPVSTNNLGQDVPAVGPNYEVPSDTVQLFGVGTCRGTKVTMEVMLHCPPFPFVISSSGTFKSTGSLLVGRLNPDRGLTALEPDDLLPGHIAANGDVEKSISLGANAVVTGDLQTTGGVDLEKGSQIRGEIRTEAAPVRIPPLNLADYKPQEARSETIAAANLNKPTLDGYFLRSGDLEITDGLNLDEGVIYVDGNLKVHGGIRGRGALIVTGTTTVDGGVELSTDNRVALLSGGSVDIKGSGKNSSFRGLVYTGGDFSASDVSVVGTFVGNKSGDGSQLVLKDARMIQEPGAVQVGLPSYTMAFDFVNQVRTAEVAPPPGGGWADAMFRFTAPNGVVKTTDIDNQDTFEPLPTSYVFRMGWTREGAMKMSLKHPLLGKAETVFPRPGPGGNVPESSIKAVQKPMVDFLNSRVATKTYTPPPLKGLATEIDWPDVDAVTALRDSGTLRNFLAALEQPKKNTVHEESYDISQFLAPGDRIRVLLWKERSGDERPPLEGEDG